MKELLQRYTFVAATLLNSAVSFIKSFFFMDILSKEELGYVALFQSVILIVGFLQLGIIHGAYRILAFSPRRLRIANNSVMTFLIGLYIFCCVALLIISFFIRIDWFWIVGTITGLFILWNVWCTNMHLVLGRTKLLSILMLVSILLSFIALPILFKNHLWGAVAFITIQPISFVILSILFNKDFRFKFQLRNAKYIKLCFNYGFIPFLTGILYFVNLQIERWVIGYDLGVESLGDYFLVFVYTSLFAVIPTAISTAYFPKMMRVLKDSGISNFSFIKVFGVFYLELFFYLVFMTIGTFLIMPTVIRLILPAHLDGIAYVNIVFFGLVPYTLINPISFIANAKLHYKELLFIYIVALVITLSCYIYIYLNKLGSLISYSYVNVLFFIVIALGYFFYFMIKGRKSLYKVIS